MQTHTSFIDIEIIYPLRVKFRFTLETVDTWGVHTFIESLCITGIKSLSPELPQEKADMLFQLWESSGAPPEVLAACSDQITEEHFHELIS